MKPWQHDEGKVWPFIWVSRRQKTAVLSGLKKERGEGVDFRQELARDGFEKGFVSACNSYQTQRRMETKITWKKRLTGEWERAIKKRIVDKGQSVAIEIGPGCKCNSGVKNESRSTCCWVAKRHGALPNVEEGNCSVYPY
ncbi:hypothetical protein PIB30_099926 [Stylosanthes scabra]|uniref:Uncharacterized protein n=1 Tax=Stylosanthes scabra TaxID=79078 RepID=A0ABU6V0S3_9FABA|nr:hypothetical protein [Stylosanthes scabra]